MSALPLRTSAKFLILFTGLFPIIFATGCTTASIPPTATETPAAKTLPSIPNDWIPVARYGRYTLMALTPRAAQHNLLLQTVQVSIPTDKAATVGEALDQVLRHSGYSLCDSSAEVSVLHDLSLPASHRHLGPLLLYDALRTLAGPAWVLEVNNTTRQVCFTRTGAPKP
ncbi:MAG: hypothetical protein EP339_04735 [Gammaproteobacteria bacterium]|nr:MAG: hypothetical protein EP339_04735 [Gammaproteobacteria bacterium]